MTKNQSLCFLKSKTNRTDYWGFPSNAKRRPIAVETPIYFVLTHFSNYHNSLHVKQTKIVFEFDRTAVKDHAWKFLAEITDNTVTIFGEEYPINWTLRLILAPCNQLQRQTKTFIISFKHNICWTEWFLFQRIVVFQWK